MDLQKAVDLVPVLDIFSDEELPILGKLLSTVPLSARCAKFATIVDEAKFVSAFLPKIDSLVIPASVVPVAPSP
jgi:hypothetical protein